MKFSPAYSLATFNSSSPYFNKNASSPSTVLLFACYAPLISSYIISHFLRASSLASAATFFYSVFLVFMFNLRTWSYLR
jgi:hypothetical protein